MWRNYTLHKTIHRKFPRNKYTLSNFNELWHLSDMKTYSKYNDGFNYVLCVFDVFSKYAYVRPMKQKNSESIKKMFWKFFNEADTTPTNLQSDKGTEFIAKDVQLYFKRKNINYYTTYNPIIQ